MTANNNLRHLDDDLILRRATREDTDALVDFNAQLHSDDGPDKPDERIGAWVRDLMEKPHPTFNPEDFTIVEQASTGKIVSSLNLISQTWSYGGIPFGVGRPELVGTLPEFRKRGLVRAQFELVHQWSAARGEKLQAITGIPYYYRQFGYEMAMNLGGGRVGYKPNLPKLKENEQEPYLVRPAVEDDLPFIAELYELGCRRSLVSCLWSHDLWKYELLGKDKRNVNRMVLCLIQSRDGQPVGYLSHYANTWGAVMMATAYELIPGVSFHHVTPSVVRYLYAVGEVYAEEVGKRAEFGGFGFWLGVEHPVYQVMHEGLPRIRNPYAWYLRLPDIPDFLRHITPVLESRLAASPYVGHSGELKLTFYRSGVVLGFENGRLTKVEPWQPEPHGHSGDAAFPELTFLQLLFGYRSFDELEASFADCWWEDDRTYGLVNALFLKQPSDVFPIN